MDPSIEVYLASVQATGSDPSILSLVLDADIIVQLTLLTLVFMSVSCWAIILQKFLRLRTASKQSARFLELFWKAKKLDSVYEQSGAFKQSPVAEVFKAGYQELAKVNQGGGNRDAAAENLYRATRRAALVEQTNLERYITWLATTGSTAPFIGLFGTVWGILRAFQKLATAQQASIQVVGPDIAHALVATAVGLVAAIPAVMAYNYFSSWVRVLSTEMENFSADFLNLVKRRVA